MALDYVETSKKIIEAVGGASNIASATNCMTRLRLVLNDESKANDSQVKAIKGVKSLIKQGGQYQVVIGNEVSNLFREFKKHGNWDDSGGGAPAKKEGNPVVRLFGFVSGCMTPLLPGLLGCGMVKVVLTILTTFFGLDTSTSTYTILYAMGDCFLYFLPVFLCYTTAKKWGGTPVLWMIVGAALMYPNMLSLLAGSSMELGTFLGMNCTYIFGIPVICATYSSSVLPILLMSPVMKVVEDFADRVSPNVLKSFMKPMLFVLICVPVCLIFLGPLGYTIGNILSGAVSAIYNFSPWLTVCILSALMPFIVMTGMHYALVPLYINNLATIGYDVIVKVTMMCSNIAQGGAAFAVAAKTKDTETKSEGIACGISAAIAGITEPAMYGINMRYITPMIGAVIGGGISGLFCGLTNVRGYQSGGSPSFLSIVTFISEQDPTHSFVFGIIGGVISLCVAFIITFFLYRDPKPAAEEAAPASAAAASGSAAGAPAVRTVISAPIPGKVVPMESIPDETFATGVLGQGFGVEPSEGKVYAPFDGTCVAVFDTLHALNLLSDTGVELLVHVGLETVGLAGKPFKALVKDGQKIKKGQLLLEFDMKMIEDMGCKTVSPVLVTNTDDLAGVKVENNQIIVGV